MNKKSNQRVSFYIVAVFIASSIFLLYLGYRPMPDEVTPDFPESCLTKYCFNVSVRVPSTNLTCNDTLFMKDGSLYCNIDDIRG